jgi:hypothetical protein
MHEPMNGRVEAPVTVLQASLRVRADHSIAHLRGAALFAADCKPLEENNSWPATPEVLLRHGASAGAAVILSVAAVEAFVNELQVAAHDGFSSATPAIKEQSRVIPSLWDTVERLPLERKLSWILQMVNVPPLPKDRDPAQSLALLLRLRNALVHYTTEWTGDSSRSAKLAHYLKGRFAENRLCMPGQQFFPYRCLGYGSGQWAVTTVSSYVRIYCEALDTPYRFETFESDIQTRLRSGHT